MKNERGNMRSRERERERERGIDGQASRIRQEGNRNQRGPQEENKMSVRMTSFQEPRDYFENIQNPEAYTQSQNE